MIFNRFDISISKENIIDLIADRKSSFISFPCLLWQFMVYLYTVIQYMSMLDTRNYSYAYHASFYIVFSCCIVEFPIVKMVFEFDESASKDNNFYM